MISVNNSGTISIIMKCLQEYFILIKILIGYGSLQEKVVFKAEQSLDVSDSRHIRDVNNGNCNYLTPMGPVRRKWDFKIKCLKIR